MRQKCAQQRYPACTNFTSPPAPHPKGDTGSGCRLAVMCDEYTRTKGPQGEPTMSEPPYVKRLTPQSLKVCSSLNFSAGASAKLHKPLRPNLDGPQNTTCLRGLHTFCMFVSLTPRALLYQHPQDKVSMSGDGTDLSFQGTPRVHEPPKQSSDRG